MNVNFYIENINFFCYYYDITCKALYGVGNAAIYNRGTIAVKLYFQKLKQALATVYKEPIFI